MKKAKIIFDNSNGGTILILNNQYAHYYDDAVRAAKDYRLYQNGTDLDDWDNNETELLEYEPDSESIMRGDCKIYSTAEITDIVNNTDIDTLSTQNMIDFFRTLKD